MAKSRDSEPTNAISGQTEALTAIQREMMEVYEQAGRDWTDRVRAEMELWTEFGKKLTSTKSVPEAMQAYQQALSQRMQMAAEDSQKVAADSQRVAQKIMRMIGNSGNAPTE
jgi:hypothetical protein